MKVVDVIAEILKRESVEFLSCYPTNPLIEAAASAGIRPLVCRHERVGVGIRARVCRGGRSAAASRMGSPALLTGGASACLPCRRGLERRMHFPASRLRIQTP